MWGLYLNTMFHITFIWMTLRRAYILIVNRTDHHLDEIVISITHKTKHNVANVENILLAIPSTTGVKHLGILFDETMEMANQMKFG